MKANLRQIQKRRKFTEEFKRQLIKEFETGKFSVLELSRLHQIPFQTIYNWISLLFNKTKTGYLG